MIFQPASQHERHQFEGLCMKRERAFIQECRQNFIDFHGHEPDGAMNMLTLRKWYDLPWRKTSIPKAGRTA